MFRNCVCIIAMQLVCTMALFAQDEKEAMLSIEVDPVVVTANRGETPAHEVGSSFTVITAEEIERSGHLQVADVLRQVAGLDVVRTGTPGQTTSIFMRGAGNSHTLVMIDGTEVNDPISPGNSYDFAHLSVDNVARIEVVRGPQSTIYGSDAMAGVVHIITKKGTSELDASLSLEAGSHGTQREALAVSGTQDRLDYSVSATHFENDGFSNAAETIEDDGYTSNVVSARLGFQANENLGFALTARHTDTEADLDNGPGAFGDDPNHVTDSTETLVKLGGHWQVGAWSSDLSVAMTDLERDTVNGIDEAHPDDSVAANYQGERMRLNWQNNLSFGDTHNLTFGLDHEEDEGEFVYASESAWGPYYEDLVGEDASTTGIYLQDHITANERLAFTVGGRYDDHDRFGDHTTWRGAFSYRVAGATFLKGSYGTGFKAPSLYQLYSPFYGNNALTPEESDGWDVGVQTRIADKVNLGFTLYNTDYDNLVDFNFDAGGYVNAGEVETRGGEFDFDWVITSAFHVAANYTYTKVEDAAGEQLVRRPRHKWNMEGVYRFGDRGDLLLGVRHVGTRNLNDFVNFTGVQSVDPFTTVHASGNVRIMKHLKLTARLENILDEEYEEVLGYNATDAAAFVGLRLDY